MNPWLRVRTLLKKSIHCRSISLARFYSSIDVTGEASASTGKKIEDFFFNQKVQSILKKITGIDYEKIFKPAQQELENDIYEFVTVERLEQMQKEAHLKALQKLQMPPILEIRKPCEEYLTKNPEIQGFLKTKLVFTDTSENVSCRDRMITVRELDGTLRTANWEERFRMNQIFFPVPGRNFFTPKAFENPYLERLLDEGSYIFVLDLACVQFEPDDPMYHKVIGETFDHISKSKKFHELRSTRHFGPMAFHFAWHNNIESLLLDMIERKMINDASDFIKMLHIIHPNIETSLDINKASDEEIIQDFIKKNTTDWKSQLELTFDSYTEWQEKRMAETSPVELSTHVSV